MTRFDERSPVIMAELMSVFGFEAFQAAAILGNIGQECGGFMYLREHGQPEGKGGYGWCQWTGPRRKSFLVWAERFNLPWQGDEANFGYLCHELEHEYAATVAAVLKTNTLHDAVRAFERNFERAGVPAYGNRDKWAARAMRAWQAHQEGKSNA